MGENPPEGVAIDYWLGAPARGPVSIEIRDGQGRLVQTLSSEPDRFEPKAHRYFAARWIRPDRPLAAGAGLHRAIWNLRWSRPQAYGYQYSIAAIAGRDTPITPTGAFAVPGDYQVVLKVDGKTWSAPLKLVEDPRVKVSQADLEASLDLSLQVSETLSANTRAIGELSAAHAQLAELARAAAGRPELLARISALQARTDPDSAGQALKAADGALTDLETSLERADVAPTRAQLDTFAEVRREAGTAAARWTALRDGDLRTLNTELKRARLKPVVFTDANMAVVAPADGGEDMP
jgi:hypothetical protein